MPGMESVRGVDRAVAAAGRHVADADADASVSLAAPIALLRSADASLDLAVEHALSDPRRAATSLAGALDSLPIAAEGIDQAWGSSAQPLTTKLRQMVAGVEALQTDLKAEHGWKGRAGRGERLSSLK